MIIEHIFYLIINRDRIFKAFIRAVKLNDELLNSWYVVLLINRRYKYESSFIVR